MTDASTPVRGAELRDRFLKFFERREHPIVPSDALIPSGDPTVLFTSAGMNQFKDAFLGKRTDLRRAASCQKCLRAGDLERVGKSASHHTFFEMLGNFSFGDYFKAEAIAWGWEFLTGTLDVAGTKPSPDRNLCVGLPNNKLWVSVYQEDEEAATLWRALGMPPERIVRFGAEDNFWPSNAPTLGPNGPCGPCSEIYYDVDGAVNGPRSVEVWNLVFTQFNRLGPLPGPRHLAGEEDPARRLEGGQLEPLPRKNIDTGMGLERLTRVAQGVETDYDTDLFAPIVRAITAWPLGPRSRADLRVFAQRAIADHIRAIVFLIADGVLPSNESRGYILRMLIRRAYRLGLSKLDVDPSAIGKTTDRTFLFTLVDAVRAAMVDAPYAKALDAKRESLRKVIRQEEAQFVQTLDSGTSRLEELLDRLSKAGQTRVPGEDAFRLYDTYGFPLELIEDIAQERSMTVDREGFQAALKVQQERSRAGSQFGGGIFSAPTMKLKEPIHPEFVGYELLVAEGRIKGIWKQDQWASEAREGDEVGIVLDRSPFYGEAGGQVGDRGRIDTPTGQLQVLDTKWADTLLVHQARVTHGTVSVEQPTKSEVDADWRLKVARSHTAAHLLHAALREVLGPETVQAGSFVEAERVRFDFSAIKGLHEEQRALVEQRVNDHVLSSDPVRTDLMGLEAAKQHGALALFGEKYGQEVRVVSIGEYSRELCGGTHLRHTGSVGTFRIVAESSIAAGTRRVEALVGSAASQRQQQDIQWLGHVAQRLSRPPHEVLQGLEELLGQLRASQTEVKTLKTELAQVRAKDLLAQAQAIDGATLICAQLPGADRDFLAAIADALRAQLRHGVAVLVSVPDPSSVAWVMAVTEDLTKRGVHAGKLLKSIAAITQGGGGGRPEFAQAGGKDPSKVGEAMTMAQQLVRDALGAK